ncbi:MAG: hypothetical protein ABIQ35_10540 [Verrucomicrobiota bacterium]
MKEATRLCSRIGIIDHGKILALGILDDLLAQLSFEDEITFPATDVTAAFTQKLAALGALASSTSTHRFQPRAGLVCRSSSSQSSTLCRRGSSRMSAPRFRRSSCT